MLVNKSTKIWINYGLGAALSVALLYLLYVQVAEQLARIDTNALWSHASNSYLAAGLLLMPVNLALEVWKWKLLAASAGPISYRSAAASYLAGMAFSLITPNRIGEYPGRILFLRKKNTPRLVSVSVLGMFAQLIAVMLFGLIGLIYYNVNFPGIWQQFILAVTLLGAVTLVVLYLRFEQWAVVLERIRWLRRFRTYKYLMKRFTLREQLTVLMLSLIRFLVFTAQYLTLLYWMNVSFPVADGFFMAALFFWVMTVIPSVALAELGIRGNVSLALFGHFSDHTVGIITATAIVWCINLALPAITGSLLWARKKLLTVEK